MNLPITQATISTNVILPCPEHGFRKNVRVATVCVKCEHFRGLAQMSSDELLPWHARYAVRCGGTVERRTHEQQEIIE